MTDLPSSALDGPPEPIRQKIAEWRMLAAMVREDADATEFDERYRLTTKAAQLEACAYDLEAALGASPGAEPRT